MPDSQPECGLIGGLGVITGDVNGDESIDIVDAMYLINYLFRGGPPPNPLWMGDLNCDGIVDVADVEYLMEYLFGGGRPPCCYCDQ